jgi:glycosyltransferase involved in cell wall biosynthesis
MKYSIIIPYRDREEHLKTLLMALNEEFDGTDYEVIVVEQDDSNKFRRGNCRNVGAINASGEFLIFHDVDYYPVDQEGEWVEYWNMTVDLFLPVKRVEFVYNDLTPKPPHEIPSGYRHFKISVDDDFYGGVLSFKRDAFFAINGFSWKFVGWGFEDADLRERVKHFGLTTKRSDDNLWYALDHTDSAPPINDPDFQQNVNMWRNFRHYLGFGVNDMPYSAKVSEPPHWVGESHLTLVHKWIKASQFHDTKVGIVCSSFNFDEGEE